MKKANVYFIGPNGPVLFNEYKDKFLSIGNNSDIVYINNDSETIFAGPVDVFVVELLTE